METKQSKATTSFSTRGIVHVRHSSIHLPAPQPLLSDTSFMDDDYRSNQPNGSNSSLGPSLSFCTRHGVREWTNTFRPSGDWSVFRLRDWRCPVTHVQLSRQHLDYSRLRALANSRSRTKRHNTLTTCHFRTIIAFTGPAREQLGMDGHVTRDLSEMQSSVTYD